MNMEGSNLPNDSLGIPNDVYEYKIGVGFAKCDILVPIPVTDFF